MIPWAMFFGLRLRVKPAQNRHCPRNGQRRVLIQTLNDLSDEWTEYPINDRLSFIRFFGLRLSDRVPDAKTVRLLQPSWGRLRGAAGYNQYGLNHLG